MCVHIDAIRIYVLVYFFTDIRSPQYTRDILNTKASTLITNSLDVQPILET
jgi:hypothetical protein